MATLLLGPLLRYVDEGTATVWVETDAPCAVEIRCPGTDAGGHTPSWRVAGHHYALVTVSGLPPGTDTPYEVLLDGAPVWPPRGSPFPPSVIRTPATAPGGQAPGLRVTFGSCRWAARPAGSHHASIGPDALDALAEAILSGGERPDVLLLLGDQVYADETSPAVREQLGHHRDLDQPPWGQVANYAEYTRLYAESWLDPEVRWLLSTIPSLMIFDDHDVVDDWNTSETWQREIRATGWWRERILGGLTSYWVYQHLGNLTPAELARDPLFDAVREAGDGIDVLRAFAERADQDPTTARWSYRRDFGRVRLLMADTRAARVLPEHRRAMLDDKEMHWLREQALEGGPGSYDHLLIGSSLPWLLPPLIHDAETWNTALCGGARGPRWARFGETLRQRADLEHWAAFPDSFRRLSEMIEEVAGHPDAPATVCVLSGDVHHAYVAEPRHPRRSTAPPPRARVLQLTCSPAHNSVPAPLRAGFRFGWSRVGRWVGRVLTRHARVERPPIRWRRGGGPWFGNQLMTLTLRGRAADLALDQARPLSTPRRSARRAAADAGAGGDAGEGAGPEVAAVPPSGAAPALSRGSRLKRVSTRQLTGPPAGERAGGTAGA
ncbi:alkaline phosphatase family protein [Streptomyces sp. AJS327]|uniref:alkaline phosphatase D family protein n=1 Tax=Streptomyces sp. AJS327 TaxID=2545265 RepID=UPI0015DE88A3|nr:alkaline phosphatase D family protein [Streptomyces sp. AJS327]MBA0050021.1 alkaline phosphatase family protein [Streptomyces sp. AJS327]